MAEDLEDLEDLHPLHWQWQLAIPFSYLRGSDHALEIEKGRHRKTNRENRLCKACEMGEIETEDHFLTKCKLYEDLKIKHNININTDSISLIRDTTPEVLGKYLLDAWSEREKAIDPPQQISTDGN